MKPSQRSLKLVTWNVNSINVRLERLLKLIDREEPDLICLQELKCTEDKFPLSQLIEKGYHCAVMGQKTYNGVAILSKKKPLHTWSGLKGEANPLEARLIAIETENLVTVCVYVPNGQEVGSEKYQYKLTWLKELHVYLSTLLTKYPNLIVCGDFNVAPDDKDVYDPKAWRDQILFSKPEKEALQNLFKLKLVDLFRVIHPDEEAFTWWDYRGFSFPKNHGLRIDLILGTSSIAELVEESYVDRNERKGTQPSDHAPVVCTFKVPK